MSSQSLQLSTTTSNPAPLEPPPFLRLPLELRLIIYTYLLPTLEPTTRPAGYLRQNPLPNTMLLYTCRLIHDEILQVWLEKAETKMRKEKGELFLCANVYFARVDHKGGLRPLGGCDSENKTLVVDIMEYADWRSGFMGFRWGGDKRTEEEERGIEREREEAKRLDGVKRLREKVDIMERLRNGTSVESLLVEVELLGKIMCLKSVVASEGGGVKDMNGLVGLVRELLEPVGLSGLLSLLRGTAGVGILSVQDMILPDYVWGYWE